MYMYYCACANASGKGYKTNSSAPNGGMSSFRSRMLGILRVSTYLWGLVQFLSDAVPVDSL